MSLHDELKTIKERAEKATEGPWYECGARYTMISRDISTEEPEDVAEVCNHYRNEEQIQFNKSFIAHARTDIPKLLRVIERLIEQRDEAIAFHCYLDKYAEQVLESHEDSKRMYNLELEELIK
jgi:hypothetical protein